MTKVKSIKGRKMAKIGDVFQLLTAEGICYGQVINKTAKKTDIIAIFRDFYDEEPKDFEQLVQQEPQIISHFFVTTLCMQGFISLVAHVPIAEKLQKFPIFRKSDGYKFTATPIWYCWDGVREWSIERPLTEEEKKYPRGPSFPSAPLILEMIENNYRVEKDYI